MPESMFRRPLIGRGCRAWPPSATLSLPYATGSAEKRLPRAAAIGRGGGGQPLSPQPTRSSDHGAAVPYGVIDLEALADPGVVIAGLWLECCLSCDSAHVRRHIDTMCSAKNAHTSGAGHVGDTRRLVMHQVDLGRPPAADHVALGSAALSRGAADTPSAA
ncbi:hypothetical protein DFH08DRAFT_824922 [Mycena albidolilacea]|uniref:Uncharacterized protein n=1 Tax=Mycena albidolilacea TaxID=1033008 RepID=A0AAD6Z2Z6_9AGAR|nr:hypothetical protein DFH08DRAFT_824922 [Mycena albidolilacea]